MPHLGPEPTASSVLEDVRKVSGGEAARILRLLDSPNKWNLASILGFWQTHDEAVWATASELYQALGSSLLKLGEPLVAYDVFAEGIRSFPEDVRLRQMCALALARSGAAGSANSILLALYDAGHRDEETLGLLARTHKDLANEASEPSRARDHLQRAYQFYLQAYQTTGGYWTAINAATLALILGERVRAEALASEVKAVCLQRLKGGELAEERYWLLSTLGESTLLLNQSQEAQRWYSQAVTAAKGDWGSLQSTRHNALLITECLGGDRQEIEQLFRLPTVVVFSGHMVDRPERQEMRFPPTLQNAVKDVIRQHLKILNAGFGYASAACGSDLIFHELILEMSGEAHVVLPCDRKLFMKESVEAVDNGDWVGRYERVIEQAVEVQEISRQSRKIGGLSYVFANRMLHGLAKVRAEQLETRLVPLAVWDGKRGRRARRDCGRSFLTPFSNARDRYLTFQFKSYFPTGDAVQGLRNRPLQR